MLQRLALVHVQSQLVHDPFISLDQFTGGKPQRKTCLFGVILDQVRDRMQAAVYSSAMIRGITEVLTSRFLLVFRDMDRMAHQLVHTLILGGRDRNYGNAQHILHPVDIDGPAVSSDLVHHIQCKNGRDTHLQKLHCQIEIALNIGGIHDIDDGFRLLLQDKISGYQFLTGVGRHGIDTRQVGYGSIGMTADHAILAVDRNAREVSDMLIRTGQLIEQCCLAAVLVAHQRKCQQRSFRQRVSASLWMELSFLTKAGMSSFLSPAGRFGHSVSGRFLSSFHIDLLGICKAQCQLIAMNAKLHGISHGSQFDQCHKSTGDYTHIQKMLPQRPFAAYGCDYGTLAGIQISDCHIQTSMVLNENLLSIT